MGNSRVFNNSHLLFCWFTSRKTQTKITHKAGWRSLETEWLCLLLHDRVMSGITLLINVTDSNWRLCNYDLFRIVNVLSWFPLTSWFCSHRRLLTEVWDEVACKCFHMQMLLYANVITCKCWVESFFISAALNSHSVFAIQWKAALVHWICFHSFLTVITFSLVGHG